MDGFHKDLDFGYGDSSNGEFIVPSGASYMTPADIPSSPAGWHGPSFVHVLDRPLRLYQLSEFSVIGKLIQSSSTMEKTYVALFDENKWIAMLIHWGDAWVAARRATSTSTSTRRTVGATTSRRATSMTASSPRPVSSGGMIDLAVKVLSTRASTGLAARIPSASATTPPGSPSTRYCRV